MVASTIRSLSIRFNNAKRKDSCRGSLESGANVDSINRRINQGLSITILYKLSKSINRTN